MTVNVKRVPNAGLANKCHACGTAYPRMYSYLGHIWCSEPEKLCRNAQATAKSPQRGAEVPPKGSYSGEITARILSRKIPTE